MNETPEIVQKQAWRHHKILLCNAQAIGYVVIEVVHITRRYIYYMVLPYSLTTLHDSRSFLGVPRSYVKYLHVLTGASRNASCARSDRRIIGLPRQNWPKSACLAVIATFPFVRCKRERAGRSPPPSSGGGWARGERDAKLYNIVTANACMCLKIKSVHPLVLARRHPRSIIHAS